MAQMKEKNKTLGKELNKMETSNLQDAEFKTLVIRMLNEPRVKVDELRDNFNKEIGNTKLEIENMKKNQQEMKNILTEMKNNLQGINSRVEAENQIGYLEYKEEKKPHNRNSKTKKESKKLRDV